MTSAGPESLCAWLQQRGDLSFVAESPTKSGAVPAYGDAGKSIVIAPADFQNPQGLNELVIGIADKIGGRAKTSDGSFDGRFILPTILVEDSRLEKGVLVRGYPSRDLAAFIVAYEASYMGRWEPFSRKLGRMGWYLTQEEIGALKKNQEKFVSTLRSELNALKEELPVGSEAYFHYRSGISQMLIPGIRI